MQLETGLNIVEAWKSKGLVLFLFLFIRIQNAADKFDLQSVVNKLILRNLTISILIHCFQDCLQLYCIVS